MARLNILKLGHPAPARNLFRTHEGAPAVTLTPEQMLRRSILTCMLWESQFYEDGVEIAGRIGGLVPAVEPARVAALAIEAREQMKLRHAPLLLVREMARHATHRGLVAETLARVIQRADELSEFVALYWAGGRAPLSGQVKKGLAAAFPRFGEYALAKYDRAGAVRLRDVLFLCHARPRDAEQAEVWKRLIDGKLATPDTWEVALSTGGDRLATWERLLTERRLGALALLRNLRNMKEAGVGEDLVLAALSAMNTGWVLPFRFLAAARYAPQWEEALERAMFRSVSTEKPGAHAKLAGRTALLVDVSGSMVAPLSQRSEMYRTDAAYGLAILLREIAEEISIFTFSDELKQVPARRGFALRDALETSQEHSGTNLGLALSRLDETCGKNREPYDRIIVITDEQSHDRVPAPRGTGYIINVASYRNGVGYGAWTHIDGWSEAVIEYIRELESAGSH
ncbi:TROVE domain-containing protein [Paracidobacterium acidisoli]|uniref:TROVE domain-containing protein n=1 Tax=Paracidobacterium acidisoli TaxID=2303751 RepID=A0A372IK42_9BACT|nr:TROVE domain-containing protein [Paracidobacterium acidisoli]MBT9332703.1 TROVE domain-containing protein [Paracidobacterium acidisoli]